jgi:HPt (histidine-containing phosphotransfer) domain-containing protein
MEPLLDPHILEDFDHLSSKQGRDVYAEMVSRLSQSWPERLRQMEEARAAGTPVSLARALHALKGTAALLGLRQLAAYLSSAESRAQAGSVDVDLIGLSVMVEQSLAAARERRAS